jgi:predicted RNA-binding Zn-ribbon protein involved in translation (DUF1610 family)
MLELPERAVADAMPVVRIVDTRREKLQEGLSAALLAGLQLRLERGEQSLVFLNRRGYAPVLACPPCGWISRCTRCAANLVLHLADQRLRCHHCGFETAHAARLPRLRQRRPAALRARHAAPRSHARRTLSRSPRLRIDRDSASTPKKWQACWPPSTPARPTSWSAPRCWPRATTFPLLTLVGAVGADAALFAADFRAPERLFAQLMQVGGRSGRAALPGEVLIQTEYPDHPLYQALVDHDYARFARNQLDERRIAGFPPFSFQAMLRAEARTMEQALAFLAAARKAAAAIADGVTLYDPVPMRLQRLMTLERGQLLVESAQPPGPAVLPRGLDGKALRAEDARRPALASRRRSAGVLVFPEEPEPARHLQRQQPAESDLVGGARAWPAACKACHQPRRNPTACRRRRRTPSGSARYSRGRPARQSRPAAARRPDCRRRRPGRAEPQRFARADAEHDQQRRQQAQPHADLQQRPADAARCERHDPEGDAEEAGQHAAAHQQQVVGRRLAPEAGKVHQPGHGPQALQGEKPPMISVDCGRVAPEGAAGEDFDQAGDLAAPGFGLCAPPAFPAC